MSRLEENIGIIVASLPTIRPLFRRFAPMTRINSVEAKGTFTANQATAHARNPHVKALEEGSLALHPIGITKTTAFKVESDGGPGA